MGQFKSQISVEQAVKQSGKSFHQAIFDHHPGDDPEKHQKGKSKGTHELQMICPKTNDNT